MSQQTTKKLIDTGTKGNGGTGDIIYDGGVKLNEMISNLYNAMADVGKFDINNGVDQQMLHATGYFQRRPSSFYNANIIQMGSMHNIDTTAGTLVIRLPKGVPGEFISFVNTNGTLSSDAPLRLIPDDMDVILGHTSSMDLTMPNTRTDLWCIKDNNGISVWTYKITSLYGDESIPINSTYTVDNVKQPIKLASREAVNSMKIILSGVSRDQKKYKSSEVLLMLDHDTKTVYANEYSVLKNTDDEVYTVSFSLESDNGLYMIVEPTDGYARVAVKSTDVVRIGG